MPSAKKEAERLRALFGGWDGGRGAASPTDRTEVKEGKGVKRVWKQTFQAGFAPDTEAWQAHLNGEWSLGVVPVLPDGTCRWGCIDVDLYGEKVVSDALKRLKGLGQPLVPCLTKSGGLHFYLFFKEPVEVAAVRQLLTDWAEEMGYAGQEVYPKQNRIAPGKNANYVNMPFFGQEPRGLDDEGKPEGLEAWLPKAEAQQVLLTDVVKKKTRKKLPPFGDGPPCLRALAESKIQDNRNIVLLNMSVYAKRKWGAEWQKHTLKCNQDFMLPPLSEGEIEKTIFKNDKEYNYTCSQEPLNSNCLKGACRGCKYGVAHGSGALHFTEVVRYAADKSIWHLTTDTGKTVSMDSDCFTSPSKFRTAVFDQVGIPFPPMNSKDFHLYVEALMEEVKVEEIPFEATQLGVFKQELCDWLHAHYDEGRDDDRTLLKKRPVKRNGKYYFGSNVFMLYLKNKEFGKVDAQEHFLLMSSLGGKRVEVEIEGSKFPAWAVAEDNVYKKITLDLEEKDFVEPL